MRVIIFLLLVANLAYAAWHFYFSGQQSGLPRAPVAARETPVAAREAEGDSLLLLSEFPAAEMVRELPESTFTSQLPDIRTTQ